MPGLRSQNCLHYIPQYFGFDPLSDTTPASPIFQTHTALGFLNTQV